MPDRLTRVPVRDNTSTDSQIALWQAIPIPRLTLTQAELSDDLKGIDAHYGPDT